MARICRAARVLVLAGALFSPVGSNGSDSWVKVSAGPFEVYSSAGERPAREFLLYLEQLRHVLGQTLGKTELFSVWPVRLLVFESPASLAAQGLEPGRLKLGRDAWVGALSRADRPPVEAITRLLIRENTRFLPPEIEEGLVQLFSTFQFERNRALVGQPVPAGQRSRAWAWAHLFCTHPDYASRVRVLFSNLESGASWQAAYWNAFQLKPEQAEQLVDDYLARGQFATREVSAAPIDPRRDFFARPVEPREAAVAVADALASDRARAAYQAILQKFGEVPEAWEGLEQYERAVKSGSRSARCYLSYGLKQQDPARAREAFEKAAELNPRWAQPYLELARLERNLARRVRLLEKATQLEPRNWEAWSLLAEARFGLEQWDAAALAWQQAGRLAPNEEARRLVRTRQQELEQKRQRELEEKRLLEERARQEQLERARAEMLARIQAAERAASGQEGPPRRVYQWWDEQHPIREIAGRLVYVDCLQAGLRITVRDGSGHELRLMIREPDRVMLKGAEELKLACGPQVQPPAVRVEYVQLADERAGSAGEVALVEFR